MADLIEAYKRRTGDRVLMEPEQFDPEKYVREPIKPGEPSTESAPETGAGYTLGEHAGAGWYVLLRGGEPVIEDGEAVTVGRGKKKAQAEVDALNESDLNEG